MTGPAHRDEVHNRSAPFGELACALDSGPPKDDYAYWHASVEIFRSAICKPWAERRRLRRAGGNTVWQRLLPASVRKAAFGVVMPCDDHGDLWNRDGKAVVYTSQPYGPVSFDDLSSMTKFAEKYGMVFRISAASWHYPAWTVLVIWTLATNSEWEPRDRA